MVCMGGGGDGMGGFENLGGSLGFEWSLELEVGRLRRGWAGE